MAEQGWIRQIATAAGTAAAAGAAQLGLGYGLGVVVWQAPPGNDAVWLGSLSWATWIAASSTVLGSTGGVRIRATGTPDRPDRPPGALWRLTLALAAALGALLTVVLTAVPARDAVRADTFAPQTVVATYAVAGVLLGLIVSIWAMGARSVAGNVIATTAWLWALATVAIVTALVSGHRTVGAPLGVWRMTNLDDRFWNGIIYWPGALLTFAAAFAIGVVAAWPGARRGDPGSAVAVSGVGGPLLVALAYLLLAPRLTGERGEQASAYLIAPYGVLAGLAGSAFIAAVVRPRAARGPGGPRPGEWSGRRKNPPAQPANVGVASVPPPRGRPAPKADTVSTARTVGTAGVPKTGTPPPKTGKPTAANTGAATTPAGRTDPPADPPADAAAGDARATRPRKPAAKPPAKPATKPATAPEAAAPPATAAGRAVSGKGAVEQKPKGLPEAGTGAAEPLRPADSKPADSKPAESPVDLDSFRGRLRKFGRRPSGGGTDG